MASRSTPTARSVTAMESPARSLPAAQCISAGTLSSASACRTLLCSAVRCLMIVRYEADIRSAALPSARIERSVSRSPSRTIFQNSAPSAGSVSGRFTFRTPGSATSGPSRRWSAALRKSKTVCRPSEDRKTVSASVACARWPLRKSRPGRTRRPSAVGSPPTSRKLRTPASSGSDSSDTSDISACGTCCVTGSPRALRPASLAGECAFDDTTWVLPAISPAQRLPGARPAPDDVRMRLSSSGPRQGPVGI
ncbi:hypothetical protein SALBM135S_05737 [Streptomyces alboniger]